LAYLCDVCGMQEAATIDRIRRKYRPLQHALDERARRLWAATEALDLGWGGVTAVAQATGLSRTTIRAGIVEIQAGARSRRKAMPRIRRPGGGRKSLTHHDPDLLGALEELVEPTSRGEPDSPLRWTTRSTRVLAGTLTGQGHAVSHTTVASLLGEAGFSLQANRKTREGKSHPDRDAQFEYITRLAKRFQRRGQPVVSVDTKKKELVGDFKNGGREYHRRGQPVEVRVHDFADKELGKAIPYGVYDLVNNEGWVSVGITHDTAEFAAATIRRWWQKMGGVRFPQASELMITADSGGSNGARTRLWKVALQSLADASGLTLTVSHFPPGTSKWNKIEHRLFSFVTQNWRGKPLVTLQAIVELIGSTRTTKGLLVKAALDPKDYPSGKKVSDEELNQVQLTRHKFHGDWNYTIRPRQN
jgi:Rhodopirellula transposase DDE domain